MSDSDRAPPDELVRQWCLKHGGHFHGPNVEHLSIPESWLPRLFAEAVAWGREQERASLLSGKGGNHKLDTDQQVFFYEQDFYVLSNFSSFTLNWNGQRFDTSEAAYHSEKFMGHGDGKILVHANWDLIETIRLAPSAHEAFKIAERNKSLRRPDWDQVKVGIMLEILHAKADQHEYVKRKLLATGSRELVEDSWRDDYWGWGPNRDGQNMLGKLWMQVRESLLTKAKEVADAK